VNELRNKNHKERIGSYTSIPCTLLIKDTLLKTLRSLDESVKKLVMMKSKSDFARFIFSYLLNYEIFYKDFELNLIYHDIDEDILIYSIHNNDLLAGRVMVYQEKLEFDNVSEINMKKTKNQLKIYDVSNDNILITRFASVFGANGIVKSFSINFDHKLKSTLQYLILNEDGRSNRESPIWINLNSNYDLERTINLLPEDIRSIIPRFSLGINKYSYYNLKDENRDIKEINLILSVEKEVTLPLNVRKVFLAANEIIKDLSMCSGLGCKNHRDYQMMMCVNSGRIFQKDAESREEFDGHYYQSKYVSLKKTNKEKEKYLLKIKELTDERNSSISSKLNQDEALYNSINSDLGIQQSFSSDINKKMSRPSLRKIIEILHLCRRGNFLAINDDEEKNIWLVFKDKPEFFTTYTLREREFENLWSVSKLTQKFHQQLLYYFVERKEEFKLSSPKTIKFTNFTKNVTLKFMTEKDSNKLPMNRNKVDANSLMLYIREFLEKRRDFTPPDHLEILTKNLEIIEKESQKVPKKSGKTKKSQLVKNVDYPSLVSVFSNSDFIPELSLYDERMIESDLKTYLNSNDPTIIFVDTEFPLIYSIVNYENASRDHDIFLKDILEFEEKVFVKPGEKLGEIEGVATASDYAILFQPREGDDDYDESYAMSTNEDTPSRENVLSIIRTEYKSIDAADLLLFHDKDGVDMNFDSKEALSKFKKIIDRDDLHVFNIDNLSPSSKPIKYNDEMIFNEINTSHINKKLSTIDNQIAELKKKMNKDSYTQVKEKIKFQDEEIENLVLENMKDEITKKYLVRFMNYIEALFDFKTKDFPRRVKREVKMILNNNFRYTVLSVTPKIQSSSGIVSFRGYKSDSPKFFLHPRLENSVFNLLKDDLDYVIALTLFHESKQKPMHWLFNEIDLVIRFINHISNFHDSSGVFHKINIKTSLNDLNSAEITQSNTFIQLERIKNMNRGNVISRLINSFIDFVNEYC